MIKKVVYALAAFLMLAADFAGPVQVFAEEVVEDTVEDIISEEVVGGGAESASEATEGETEAEDEVTPEVTSEGETTAESESGVVGEAAGSGEVVEANVYGGLLGASSTNVTTSDFAGLLDAFDATWDEEAEPGTVNIRLEGDIVQTYGDEDYLGVNAGWTVNLDLNGHTLTLRNDGPRGLANYGGTLIVTGNGTITNSTDGTMNESYGLIDNYGGTAVIKNGTFVDWGQGGGAALKNRTVSFDGGTTWAQGILTIEAATITAYATDGGNGCVYSDGVLTVADGVEIQNYATDGKHNGYHGAYAMTVSSGTATIGATAGATSNPVKVTGQRGGLGVNSGTVTINNGIYKGNTWYGIWITNDGDRSEVNIKYAEATGARYGVYFTVDDGKQDLSNVGIKIEDGVYTGGTKAAVAINESKSEHSWGMEISGGWYSTEPDESYIVDGYTTYEINDGYLVAPEFNELRSRYVLNSDNKSFAPSENMLSELPEGLTYVVEDSGVAKVTTNQYTDEDITFTQTYLRGVNVGTTKVKVMYGGYVLDEATVVVYSVETNLRSAQEVGTSQTFRFDASEGFEVIGAMAFTYGDDAVVFTDNEDGTYTLTVNAFPTYTDSDGEVVKDTIVEVMVGVVDGDGDAMSIVTLYYPVVLYAMAAEDAAGEAVSAAAEAVANEKIMRGYVAEVVDKVFGQYVENITTPSSDTVIVTLDDGTVVNISNVKKFMEALGVGGTIEAVLTEPAALDEIALDSKMTSAMYGVMGDGKTGHRFVDISVELRSGDEVLGYITELGTALKVSVDVSADGAPAAGFTRIYHVVRYHNGVAEEIEGVEYDPATGVIKFDSDKFSTYLIAYEDVLSATADTGVFTGESASATSSQGGVVAAIAAATGLVLGFGAVKLAKRK